MPEQIKKRLEEEIKQLEYELTTELPAEIKKAVALGDLSENAEYHMAKQRQVFVNARLGQLKKRMGELALVNLTNIPHDKVGFGATVTVFDTSKDEEIVYKLVTSEESDVAKGLISTTSPIGRALSPPLNSARRLSGFVGSRSLVRRSRGLARDQCDGTARPAAKGPLNKLRVCFRTRNSLQPCPEILRISDSAH